MYADCSAGSLILQGLTENIQERDFRNLRVSEFYHTAVPINNLLALHKQYTDCPTNLAGYEVANLYKSLLFIRNIL